MSEGVIDWLGFVFRVVEKSIYRCEGGNLHHLISSHEIEQGIEILERELPDWKDRIREGTPAGYPACRQNCTHWSWMVRGS